MAIVTCWLAETHLSLEGLSESIRGSSTEARVAKSRTPFISTLAGKGSQMKRLMHMKLVKTIETLKIFKRMVFDHILKTG
jgi:hypothetical protein